jgi:hypothetical protein
MKTDWVIVAEICQERHVDMDVIVRPEKYRDDISSANRARTLKEAAKRGVTIQGLSSLCPLSERRLRSIVGNGELYNVGNGLRTDEA